MRFEEAYEGWNQGRLTQAEEAQHRCHYVKAKVRVNRYANGALALFHGPRGLAYFTPEGRIIFRRCSAAIAPAKAIVAATGPAVRS